MSETTTPLSPDDARAELLAAYDAQLRAEAEMSNCRGVRRIGPVLVGEFTSHPGGFVSYAHLGGLRGGALDALIDDVIAHLRDSSDVPRFEWKTRGHDEPADLPRRLEEKGFVPEEIETVMVGAVDAVAQGPTAAHLPPGVVVRQAGSTGHRSADLEGALALQEEVFGHPAGTVHGLTRELAQHPDRLSFWLAEADGGVIGAGRITREPRTDFASIWGGAMHPRWRGRGIYRVLTAERARWARARSARFLHSDSTAFSRPILERSGLSAITTTTPYIWTRA